MNSEIRYPHKGKKFWNTFFMRSAFSLRHLFGGKRLRKARKNEYAYACARYARTRSLRMFRAWKMTQSCGGDFSFCVNVRICRRWNLRNAIRSTHARVTGGFFSGYNTIRKRRNDTREQKFGILSRKCFFFSVALCVRSFFFLKWFN